MEKKKYSKALKSELVELEDNKGIVTIAVSAYGNCDWQNDIMCYGCYDKTISEGFNNIYHYANHDDNLLIGVPLKAWNTDKHLIFQSQLCLDNQLPREIYNLYKLYNEHNRTLKHSVGISVIQRDKTDKRKITEAKLWEFSTLTKAPANDDTPLIDIKSLSANELENELSLCKRALELKFDDETLASYLDKLHSIEKALKGEIINETITNNDEVICKDDKALQSEESIVNKAAQAPTANQLLIQALQHQLSK